MDKNNPHLLFRKTWVDFLKEEFSIDPNTTMKVFFAICDYAYDGIVPDDAAIRMAIGTIRKEIDKDKQSYLDISEKRSQARKVAINNQKQKQQNEQMLSNATNATNPTKPTNIIYSNVEYNNNTSLSNDNSVLDNNKKTKAKKVKPDALILTDEEIAFNNELKSQFPRISKMEHPLTYDEYSKLVNTYGEDFVIGIMGKLENYKKINNYVSSKATIENWCKLELERNGNNKQSGKAKPDLLSEIFGGIAASQH